MEYEKGNSTGRDDEIRGTTIAGCVFALIAGLAGISFGVSGAIIFPFVPNTIAGSMLAVTSAVTCYATTIVLRASHGSRNIRSAAHKAIVIVIIIQIASAFTLVLIATGARHNFCDTRKPCYVFSRAISTDEKCTRDDGKACIEDYSYLCHKTATFYDPSDEALIFIGNKNCDTTLSDRCNGGDRFWGFDDRDDCLDFYVKNRKQLAPNLSTGLILAGSAMQIVFTSLLAILLRSAVV